MTTEEICILVEDMKQQDIIEVLQSCFNVLDMEDKKVKETVQMALEYVKDWREFVPESDLDRYEERIAEDAIDAAEDMDDAFDRKFDR